MAGMLPAKATSVLAAGTISLTGPYTQDFDSLANVTGSTTNTVSIVGWDLSESGDGTLDNERYGVDSGESSTGDTYSYGSADSSDRALGGLGDDALIPTIGASLTNTTGATITSLDIAYTGEQWRLGTSDRADRLDFQISTSATTLSTGRWTDVDALDFATPSTGSPIGPRHGNEAASRTSVAASIGGLSIPDGATFWIRWVSVDAAGSDDGLAVDDFALTPHVDAAPAVAETDPADGAAGVAPGASLTVTFDAPVNVTVESFTIECATSGVHPATVSGGRTRFVLDPATDFAAGERCTVTVVAAGVTDQDSDDPPDNPTADHVFTFRVQPAPPAEPPVAGDDVAVTDEDRSVGVQVTANDTDADGDLVPRTVRVVVAPAAGIAAVAAGGVIRYSPDPDFDGRDRFQYEVCDTGGRCDRAMVTVSVAAKGDRPIAGDDSASTDEDSPVRIRVTANDVDADGNLDVDSLVVVNAPAHGRAVVVGGSIRYRPDPNFHGQDRFEYRVCDASGRCDRAQVTLSVAAVGDRPAAGEVVASTDEDRPVTVDVTGSVSDPDGDLDVDSLVVVNGPRHGRAVVDGGSITYRPDRDFHGRDRFAYLVCDTSGRCDRAPVTVTVAAVADRPMATDDIASTHEDSPTDVPVTANDTDVDGDLVPVAVQIVRPPAAGAATVAVDGTIRYRPDLNFHGRDRFSYRVCDASGRCDRATVTVSVAAVADRPVATDDIASTDEDSPIGIRVTANDTDVDGDLDAHSVMVVRKPAHGRAVAVGGSIRYRPDRNFHGHDRFDYRVCDSRSACVTASVAVAIRPVNDAPVAVPDVVIVVRAGKATIEVLGNDFDVDGPTELDPTSVMIVSSPSLGSATVNATSGTIEYIVSLGTNGTDRLTYRVCDVGGQCATAQLEIRVDLPPTPPPGTLPRTGPHFGSRAGAAALAAVGVGGLLFTASRRTSLLRRRPSS